MNRLDYESPYLRPSSPRSVPGLVLHSDEHGRVRRGLPRGWASTDMQDGRITLHLDRQPQWPMFAPVAALARLGDVYLEAMDRLREAWWVLRHGVPHRW